MTNPRREIVAYGLAERPALANNNLVPVLHTKAGRHVGSKVLVSLLVSVVLRDVVEVFAADDQCSVHLGRDNGAGEDAAANRDETSEGALLV